MRSPFNWLFACLLSLAGSQSRAASRGSPEPSVIVSPAAQCLHELALLHEIQAVRPLELDPRLRIVVNEIKNRADVTIEWSGTVRVSRTFEDLPRRCADRLALVAVAIAVALDDRFPEVAPKTTANPSPATAPNTATSTKNVESERPGSAPNDGREKRGLRERDEPSPTAKPDTLPLYKEGPRSEEDPATTTRIAPVKERKRRRAGFRLPKARAWTSELFANVGVRGDGSSKIGGSLAATRHGPILAQRITFGAQRGGRVAFENGETSLHEISGAFDLCKNFDAATTIHFLPCLGIRVSPKLAQGRGYTRNYSTWLAAPIAALTTGIGIRLDLNPRWAMEARVDLSFDLAATRLEVTRSEVDPESSVQSLSYVVSRWAFGFNLGPSYRF
jgi:hypothetical protein